MFKGKQKKSSRILNFQVDKDIVERYNQYVQRD